MSIHSTDTLTQYLTARQIPYKLHAHASTESASAWSEAIKSLGATPTKSLLVKPKGMKTGDAPILIVALDSTRLDLNGMAKSAPFGGKEARVAADNVVADTLKVEKLNGMCCRRVGTVASHQACKSN